MVALLWALFVLLCRPGNLRPGLFLSGQDSITPTQVHVSLAGADHIRVSWITKSSLASSQVEYGKVPGLYKNVVDGRSDSYTILLYKSGHVHNAVIGPLEPATTYYYRCSGVDPEYSFKTPPSSGPQTKITFAVAGDLGQSEWTLSTLSHISNLDFDVFILPGDLSYADFYQPRWDSFGELVEPLASLRPWMVTQGNHELEHIPLLVDAFKSYNIRWRMPYEESGSDSNLYYSFDVAGVHVLMLGSYADVSRKSKQYKWLQADLAKVDRNETPWLFAVIHAPWYNSNSRHRGDGEEMRQSMEFLLKEAKVDLVFAGHVHAYERTARVFNGQLDGCGIVHLTVGVGGNREGLADRFLVPEPSWSVFREASFGFGRLEVVNATHAHWTWHRNSGADTVATDEVWIRGMAGSHACD